MENPTKPSAPRMQKMRDQRREAGLVKLELWVPADKKAEIKALVEAFINQSSPQR